MSEPLEKGRHEVGGTIQITEADEAALEAIAKAEARSSEIITDMARRVHTVMCAKAESLARGQPGGIVNAADSQSLIHGAVSGIAVLVARMAITRDPNADPADQRTPEEFYAEVLMNQFISVYRTTQMQDSGAALGAGATTQ